MNTNSEIGRYPLGRKRLGVIALWCSIIALIGGIVTSAIVGATIGLSALTGDGDAPQEYSDAIVGVGASFFVWGALGLAGLVLGVIAIIRGSRRGAGIAGVILALAAPLLSFAAIAILTFTTAPPVIPGS